jgi:transposase InsO family protein
MFGLILWIGYFFFEWNALAAVRASTKPRSRNAREGGSTARAGPPRKTPVTHRVNANWFQNLVDARGKIAAWWDEYNSERPHSSLGYRTPNEFAEILKSSVMAG